METGEKYCNEVVDYYPPISAQETKQTNKQTNKQSNLLTLTVSCEKRNCLMISKKEKNKIKIK